MVAELGFDQSTDPVELIPGSTSALQIMADTLKAHHTDLVNVVQIVDGYAIDGWDGPAAKKFTKVFGGQSDAWNDAATSFQRASDAVASFRESVLVARNAAGDAAALWLSAQKLTESAHKEYEKKKDKDFNAGKGNIFTYPGFEDPGEKDRRQANQDLADARTKLKNAGDHLAETLDRWSENAPAPDRWAEFWGEVGRVASIEATNAWSLFSGYATQLFENLVIDTWNMLPPAVIFDFMQDPQGAIDDGFANLEALVTDPVGFFGNIISLSWEDFIAADLWGENPQEALGRVQANVASLVAPGAGIFKGAKLAKLAAKAAKEARVAARIAKVKAKINALVVPDEFRPKTALHIFNGEFRGKKTSGYHSEAFKGARARIEKGTRTKPDKNGVYEAKVVGKVANGGYSTFFPKKWSPERVIDEIENAMKNGKLEPGKEYIYRGEASDGTPIEYVLNRDGKVVNAYPVFLGKRK